SRMFTQHCSKRSSRARATHSTAWSGRAPASGCRHRRSACSNSLRRARRSGENARPPPKTSSPLDWRRLSGNYDPMVIGGNAEHAISSGREGLESLADWFAANWDELPIALGSAAAIILVMLALRWAGSRLLAGDPESRHWRGVIGRVLHKTTIIFM